MNSDTYNTIKEQSTLARRTFKNLGRSEHKRTKRLIRRLQNHYKKIISVSTKCRLQTADCRLQTGYKMQTRYKMQTADCRLQTGYKMQSETKIGYKLQTEGKIVISCSRRYIFIVNSPLSCNRLSEFVSSQFPLHMNRLRTVYVNRQFIFSALKHDKHPVRSWSLHLK